MSLIDNEKITQIRTSVDIIDVIASYISLEPKGKNFFGICPFHDDKNPSMSVSKEKQIYTCFSCGATGNVYKFLMDYDNITFIEAVKKVASMAGINLNIATNNFSNKFQTLYDIYNLSNKFYQNNLQTDYGRAAKEYLEKRGITKQVIKRFSIGFALKDKSLLYNMLKSKGFKENDILVSGLVNKNEYGYHDVYHGRIMFPLHDLNGKIVGYSGRIIDKNDTAKYINTKETPIFKKGELLYNYHQAKEAVKKANEIIVVEGFMDVIKCSTIGIDNVIATMGTAVTKGQAMAIKKLSSNVIICFDGDQAGLKATISLTTELAKVNIVPRIIRLKDNLDPDEYITKYNHDAFLNEINNSVNMIDFKIACLKQNKNLESSTDMAAYVNSIIDFINKIDDDILREITLKKLSDETKLDIKILQKKIISPPKKAISLPKQIKRNKYMKAESYLIYYMLNDVETIKQYQKNITYMPTERYRYLAREIDSFYQNYNTINVADLISYLGDNQNLITTVGEIITLELKEKVTGEEIDDYIKTIRQYNINNKCTQLKKQMSLESDSDNKVLIAKQIIELKIKETE
ncbi:MAG: DNA primase [Bacilli bacterium]